MHIRLFQMVPMCALLLTLVIVISPLASPRDPTSRSLWPFEPAMVLGVTLVATIARATTRRRPR